MESSLPGGPYALNVLGLIWVFLGKLEHVAREYSEVKGEKYLIASLYGSLGGVSTDMSLGGGVSTDVSLGGGVFMDVSLEGGVSTDMSLGIGVSMDDSLEISPHVFTTECVVEWRNNNKNTTVIIKKKRLLTNGRAIIWL